ncbi:MAG: phosphoenolpyruvate--protein phosphotransferase [Desulfuromonadia bacterium]
MTTPSTIGLSTIEDITTLILRSHDLPETLDNIVSLVSRQMGVEVCSIYILDEDGVTLTLKATRGLSRGSVGKVSMQVSEGLTGLVVETQSVVNVRNAPEHPRYKYFRGSREERYHSFLGLPLMDRRKAIGAIIVQCREEREFSDDEIRTLSAIAYQISSIVVNATLLDSIRKRDEALRAVPPPPGATPPSPERGTVNLSGIPASPGFAIGMVAIIDHASDQFLLSTYHCASPKEEMEKFTKAVEEAKIQTLYLEKQVARRIGEEDAAIFHAHLMILEDRGFISRVHDLIQSGKGAYQGIMETVDQYVSAFGQMDDPYLRARSADLEDIRRRLLACLTGNTPQPLSLPGKRIIAGHDILPSDLATLDHTRITGILTERGNVNSHAAIMAKSLGIPALLGIPSLLRHLSHDDEVILDGNTGHLYIRPDRPIRQEYERLLRYHTTKRKELESLRDTPCITTDGVKISLRANIGLYSEVKIARHNGAEGVGLYRTEFPYMTRPTFPDRYEQRDLYRRVVESFPGHPVTIRTLDIGGDKTLPYFDHPPEDNPFMGWRSIRISLTCRDIFREQLIGILLASRHGHVRVMFPMIGSIEELRTAKEILEEARGELPPSTLPRIGPIPVGVMVETPAAVQIIDLLCREVDFLSIGTNDLIQYTLAVDRNNPKMKGQYTPFHPAVLRSLRQVCKAAAAQGVPVSICGEMASDPLNAMVLTGIGITDFSMASPALLPVKHALMKTSVRRCRDIARTLLDMATNAEMEAYTSALRRDMGF